jgi:hypothetical protein
MIAGVEDVATANEALAFIQAAEVIWDSQRIARHRLNERIKEQGIIYDRTQKTFVAQKVAEPEMEPV